jgi:hypothetical protein
MTAPVCDALATACAVTLASLILPQAGLTAWFAWNLWRRARSTAGREPHRDVAATTPAEVTLCLRGADAELGDVFRGLARQRHADWRLRVVVDSPTDPAWNVAERLVAECAADATWREAIVEPLAGRPVTGSLKCASLRQVLLSLAPETSIVALIDADTVPHDIWLTTMIDECLHDGVGAVSGNRWYEPASGSVAGTVRRLWNAGAIVQMTAFGIPWGGSLALRREAIEASGWAEVIRTSLCEDTALAMPLARSGWKHRLVPAVIAVSDDDRIGTRPLTRWIARQLLTARLHHPLWPLVALHGLVTSLALVASVIVAGVAAWRGQPMAAALVLLAVAAYEAASIVLMVIIEQSVRIGVRPTGRTLWPPSLTRLAWQAAVLPLTQAVYAVATLMALAARSVEWRGIVYDIVRTPERVEVRPRP